MLYNYVICTHPSPEIWHLCNLFPCSAYTCTSRKVHQVEVSEYLLTQPYNISSLCANFIQSIILPMTVNNQSRDSQCEITKISSYYVISLTDSNARYWQVFKLLKYIDLKSSSIFNISNSKYTQTPQQSPVPAAAAVNVL